MSSSSDPGGFALDIGNAAPTDNALTTALTSMMKPRPHYKDTEAYPEDEKYELFANFEDGTQRAVRAHPNWTTEDLKLHMIEILHAEKTVEAHEHCVKAMKHVEGADGHKKCWHMAIDEFKLAYEAGDSSAGYNLYIAYSGHPEAEAVGVKANYSKALKYLMGSAQAEHGDAQFAVGRLFYHGERGYQKDFEKAEHWWLKAAHNGQVDAQHNLGVLYYKQQIHKDDHMAECTRWLKTAALNGHEPAKINYRRILMSLKGETSIPPPPSSGIPSKPNANDTIDDAESRVFTTTGGEAFPESKETKTYGKKNLKKKKEKQKKQKGKPFM